MFNTEPTVFMLLAPTTIQKTNLVINFSVWPRRQYKCHSISLVVHAWLSYLCRALLWEIMKCWSESCNTLCRGNSLRSRVQSRPKSGSARLRQDFSDFQMQQVERFFLCVQCTISRFQTGETSHPRWFQTGWSQPKKKKFARCAREGVNFFFSLVKVY